MTVRWLKILCCILISGVSFAQETSETSIAKYSLSDILKKSIAYSPSLTVAEMDLAEAQAKQAQAKAAGVLPSISLQITGGPIPDVPQGSGPEGGFPEVSNGFGSIGPFVRGRVEAIQPIYTFGKISKLQSAASHGVSAKEFQKIVARNNLVFDVKRTYHTLRFLYSLYDFINELDSRTQKAKEKIEERLKSGSGEATDVDLMRLEVFRGETEKRKIELENGIRFARETLGVLMGMSPNEIDIADQSIRVEKIDLKGIDYYLNRTKVARPEMSQLQEAVKAAEAYMKSVKANYFPSFFMAGFYNYAKAPDRQSINNPFLVNDFNFNGGGVFFGMEQKLSFHLTNAKYREALAQYKKVSSQRDLAFQGIEIEVRKSYADFAARQKSYDSSERAFKAGRSWVLATTLNFGAGLVPIKDLLEAFVAYSRVKANYLDVMYEFNITLSQLSRVVGEELTDVKY
ncbi:MAG: TolC family protein [Bdellovibrionales bacterium]|nr:TolC family protein [Bdellovibrionales bacterium]